MRVAHHSCGVQPTEHPGWDGALLHNSISRLIRVPAQVRQKLSTRAHHTRWVGLAFVDVDVPIITHIRTDSFWSSLSTANMNRCIACFSANATPSSAWSIVRGSRERVGSAARRARARCCWVSTARGLRRPGPVELGGEPLGLFWVGSPRGLRRPRPVEVEGEPLGLFWVGSPRGLRRPRPVELGGEPLGLLCLQHHTSSSECPGGTAAMAPNNQWHTQRCIHPRTHPATRRTRRACACVRGAGPRPATPVLTGGGCWLSCGPCTDGRVRHAARRCRPHGTVAG